jgi:hypothetical protein
VRHTLQLVVQVQLQHGNSADAFDG